MNVLNDEALRACREHGESLALVRVTKAEIDNAGTRSEMAILDLAVERILYGEAPPSLRVWRYTSRGDTLLREGRKYVVTFAPGTFGPVDWDLGAFVAIPDGKESEVVEAHLAALKRVATGPSK